jgi:hypothetical protein
MVQARRTGQLNSSLRRSKNQGYALFLIHAARDSAQTAPEGSRVLLVFNLPYRFATMIGDPWIATARGTPMGVRY